jgi:uncharacterized protein YbjQ (UPF0145 family)
MIITTTNSVEGYNVKEYKGIVFGEVVAGVNLLKDFLGSLRNLVGGRSGTYEEELTKSREAALKEIEERANIKGANAVLGVKVDYETIDTNGNVMMLVMVTGTAVVLDKI